MRPTLTRRSFLGSSLAAGALVSSARVATAGDDRKALEQRLDEVAAAPVLRVDGLDKPRQDRLDGIAPQRAKLCGPGEDDRRCRGDRRPQRDAPDPHLPDLRQPSRPVLRGQRRPPARALALGAVPPQRQLQVPGPGPLGLRGGRRVRDPRPARQADRAGRSATCWAGSNGATSPSTGPAASGATRPRKRSPISSSLSPRPERRRSSSASAAG